MFNMLCVTKEMSNNNNYVNRLIGRLPKVGIRPVIDARLGGVRESLEGKTMQMAKSVKRLITENLRHTCGAPVECIISDSTIGRVAEAAACDDKFTKEGVAVSITVTPCWCYGSETMDMNPYIPKAVWGFNGSERPGAVYLAAVLAAYNQKGLPAFSIYGKDVQEATDTNIPEDVKEKLLSFAKAGIAAATMRGKSYLSMGGVSMGIAGSIVNDKFFQEYLGMRNEYVDMSEFKRRMDLNIYDTEEYNKAFTWVKQNCKEGSGNSVQKQASPSAKEADWQNVIKMSLIARDLMIGNPRLKQLGFGEEALGFNAIAAGFQGQRQWTDYFPTGDFMETILNSSFDWNGMRQPFILATENDSLNAVSMLFGHLLTNTASIFADVRTFWSPDAIERVTGTKLKGMGENGLIHLINSGAAALDGTGEQEIDNKPAVKPFWDITEQEVKKCLDATLFQPVNHEYFMGGGFSTDFLTKGNMPATMIRVNLVKGIGPVLQLAEGHTVDISEKVHDILDRRTDPTWPTTWFAPLLNGKGAFKDVYSVMANWGANHASLSYGHIGADLITLASMLRIPVCMHNIADERIFRPATWSAFGTKDYESADFRACTVLGPLYR